MCVGVLFSGECVCVCVCVCVVCVVVCRDARIVLLLSMQLLSVALLLLHSGGGVPCFSSGVGMDEIRCVECPLLI